MDFKQSDNILFNRVKDIRPNTVPSEACSYRSYFMKWVDVFTMHGIPNIFRSNNLFIKCMWAVAFLLSSGLCIFLIIQSVVNYSNFDVITKIRVLNEVPMTFPTVTICNKNAFVTEESYKLSKDLLAKSGVTDIFNSSVLSQNFPSNLNQLQKNYFFSDYLTKSYTKTPEITDAQRKLNGFAFDKFIISCQFQVLDCTIDDFEWYYDFYNGNCFKFNPGRDKNGNKIPLKKVGRTGLFSGLLVELYVGESNNSFSMSQFSGAHLFIHNDSSLPDTLGGIDLPTGHYTNIIVNRVIRHQLPYPYSDCVNNLDSIDSYDSELYRATIRLNSTYRQSDCTLLCLQKKIKDTCGCYDTTASAIPSTRPCLTITDLQCSYGVFLKFDVSECKSSCPLECSSISYPTTLTSVAYPSNVYGQDLLKTNYIISRFNNRTKLTVDDLRKNILAFNIYFDELKYTSIEELPNLTLDQLIAGIGGTLGLFLGVSMLSLFEISELIIEISIIFFKRQLLKRKKVSQSQSKTTGQSN